MEWYLDVQWCMKNTVLICAGKPSCSATTVLLLFFAPRQRLPAVCVGSLANTAAHLGWTGSAIRCTIICMEWIYKHINYRWQNSVSGEHENAFFFFYNMHKNLLNNRISTVYTCSICGYETESSTTPAITVCLHTYIQTDRQIDITL